MECYSINREIIFKHTDYIFCIFSKHKIFRKHCILNLLNRIYCHNFSFLCVFNFIGVITDFSGSTSGKESASQYRRLKRHRFDSWVEKFPWRREWQPTPVLLPGKSHGQRSLEGCSP